MAKKQPNFEKQMERLQEIVEQLENMDIPLSANVALYKEGKNLAASCSQLLEEAKNEVRLCDKDTTTSFSLHSNDSDGPSGLNEGTGDETDEEEGYET